MPSKEEKQVDQLLINANQSLNFLRTVLDDLLFIKDKLTKGRQKRVYDAQRNYRVHKAVLTNIENLLSKRRSPLSEKSSNLLANSLRVRISRIIEEAIESDRFR